ncbi:hypothetical protein SAMN05421644_11636 [Allochromatium warmingii]|uniref:Uncharacterized protein n=1 Tax=Allochromatium warmingii TaxID=61595 RepID=A0A1H3F4N2_ALLWA|nr:hypothetical protein [Allochromatium warmingii]SDX85942.1 hypothetical protein SAMN05421644_11636 [Allochromatium warmingii]
MALNQYVWIYSLAEMLAVVLVVAIVFGIKWWHLRQERRTWLGLSVRVERLIDDEIAATNSKHADRPELRDSHLAILCAIAKPFQDERLTEDQAWSEVIGLIDRYITALTQVTARPTTQRTAAPPAATPAEQTAANAAAESREVELINGMLQQCQRGRSTLPEGENLQRTYQDMIQTQEQLMARVRAAREGCQLDMDALQADLTTATENNSAFMQAAHTTERNIQQLEQIFEDFEARIHNLQVTINTHRKSAQKLITERNSLQQDKELLLGQLAIKEKIIARLNRSYETLRREYVKIYEGKL